MATRVMAIAATIIDQTKADALNAASGLDLAPAQWQVLFGVLMADSELQAALTVAKNREAAHRSVIKAVQDLSATAVEVGEPDYMAEALTAALATLATALQRPYNPATDSLATAEE